MTKILSIKTEPREASFSRAYRHIDVGNDVTLDDLLTPGFWAHHANTLQSKDLLDVLSEDMQLDVQLRVIEPGVGFVTMRQCVVRHNRSAVADVAAVEDEDTSELPAVPKGYKVGWNVGKRTYYVQSNLVSPAQIVSEDHETRRDGIEAAIAHAAKVGTKLAA